MQSALRSFGTALRSVTGIGTVHHYWHPVQYTPWTVWAEQRETNTFNRDNRKAELIIEIAVDYWTKTEYDRTVDAIQDFFENHRYVWTLDSVLYENETNLIHWSWTIEITVPPEAEDASD